MASDVIFPGVCVPVVRGSGDIQGRYKTGSLVDNDWLGKGP